MRVGYVRVSSLEQNTVRQLDGVEVERTFTDRASGKDTARPKLAEMLAFVREGDTVLVHSMDRLARNLEDLRGLVRTLTGKGARVEFVKEGLVFTGEDSPMATLLLSVMGAFAEFERSLILERQREGIAAARQRGAYTGRKPALTPARARELRERATAGERKSALAAEWHQPRNRLQLPAGRGRRECHWLSRPRCRGDVSPPKLRNDPGARVSMPQPIGKPTRDGIPAPGSRLLRYGCVAVQTSTDKTAASRIGLRTSRVSEVPCKPARFPRSLVQRTSDIDIEEHGRPSR
jgi:DNA invertase Pin-like site-specific DNA recombinase